MSAAFVTDWSVQRSPTDEWVVNRNDGNGGVVTCARLEMHDIQAKCLMGGKMVVRGQCVVDGVPFTGNGSFPNAGIVKFLPPPTPQKIEVKPQIIVTGVNP